MDTPTTKTHARVVSETPGRTRVRLEPGQRGNARLMEDAKADLQQRDGVAHVGANNRTGSLTVTYDASKVSHGDVLAMLRDAGVIAERTMAALGEELPSDTSTTGASLSTALGDLNRRLLGRTGGRLDLKLLFPATLAAVGLRQLFTTGLGLAEVPAYVLLWYAFDSFYKFHAQRRVQTVGASRPDEGAASDGEADQDRAEAT